MYTILLEKIIGKENKENPTAFNQSFGFEENFSQQKKENSKFSYSIMISYFLPAFDKLRVL